jgi:hypothetical protein
MTRLLEKFWSDDCGMVMATELAFLMTTLVIGTVGGLAAMRQAAISESVELANAIMALDQSYYVPGQTNSAGASVGGSAATDAPNIITSGSTAPTAFSPISQSPCD